MDCDEDVNVHVPNVIISICLLKQYKVVNLGHKF